MSSDPPAPWRAFLTTVDRLLPRSVELHCLGGFVITNQYRLPRATNDLDYLEIVPHDAMAVLEEIAGRSSDLARRHGVHFQHVGVVTPPEAYVDRLQPLFPGGKPCIESGHRDHLPGGPYPLRCPSLG